MAAGGGWFCLQGGSGGEQFCKENGWLRVVAGSACRGGLVVTSSARRTGGAGWQRGRSGFCLQGRRAGTAWRNITCGDWDHVISETIPRSVTKGRLPLRIVTAPTPLSPLHERMFVAGRPHPRVTMRGPRVGGVASVPIGGGPGALPYDEGGRPRRSALVLVLALLLVAVAVGALTGVVASSDDGGAGDRPGNAAGRSVGRSAVSSRSALSRSAVTSVSTPSAGSITRPTVAPRTATSAPQRPAPTEHAPATTSPRAVARSKPALHGATYRGGKLYLAGALPSRKLADAFVKKASEVIGAENVVEHYVIDKRAPVPTDGRVRVDEPFLFPPGSASINPAYSSLLNLGVTVMRINPKVTMKVVGFTDDTGQAGVNKTLSRARAQAVADWITIRGISAKRFIVIGKGPSDPVESNATPGGRTRNRRIEVELLGLLKG